VSAAGDADDRFAATVADPDGAVSHRYGMNESGGLVLIRPDGYIGLRADLDRDDAVDEYLAGIAG
jgi:hypothetical protein